MENFNLNKSIEELENDFLTELEFNSSLVVNCHNYRKIPLIKIEAEQIRLLLGQDIGVKYLLLLALNILKNNPHIECIYFPSDLLLQMSSIRVHYWNKKMRIKPEE